MKNVIYITNQEIPYKVEFFNQLAKKCNLKVFFETKKQNSRNLKWANSIKNEYDYEYLYQNKKKKLFSIKLLKSLIKSKDSIIIFGCSNEKIEITTIMLLKLLRKKYWINIDGEYFLDEKNFKTHIKKLILKGAHHYMVAGNQIALKFKKDIKAQNVTPYSFTSLTQKEVLENANNSNFSNRSDNKILIVSKYSHYKGIDLILKMATKDNKNKYCFVGIDKAKNEFEEQIKELGLNNVEVIPFLQKKELNEMYRNCKMLILPSRRECWGLVINEAASHGMPIVSTYGSGAAVEYLQDSYQKYLAKTNNADDLLEKVKLYENSSKSEKQKYVNFLLEKSKKYTIENIVDEHIKAFNEFI